MKVSISDLLGVKKKRRFFSLTFDSFSDEVIIVKTLLLIFMILFSVVIHASAPPVVLEDGKVFYLIGLNLDILEDLQKSSLSMILQALNGLSSLKGASLVVQI